MMATQLHSVPSQESSEVFAGTAKPNGKASTPVQPLPADDPFAASNFAAAGEEVPTSIDDLAIELGVPSDEDFVLVSSDPRHSLKANLLIVKREDGYGKSYFLLKFVKTMHIFLYKVNDGGYGLWLIRDSLDNWSVSELQVVNQAKKVFTRRYNDGKVRKGHESDAISTSDVVFPDKPLAGPDGLLKQAFGDAFVITSTDHPVLNKLLGRD
jgi:hypothetical protein